MAKPTKHYGKCRVRWTDENGVRLSETFDRYGDAFFAQKKHELEVHGNRRRRPTGFDEGILASTLTRGARPEAWRLARAAASWRVTFPMTPTSLVRLLHLSSPSLPVGAYSYSQGLEAALATGVAVTPEDIERWFEEHLALVLPRNDLAFGWRLSRAWAADDPGEAVRWNEAYLASRDSAELRAETVQMGQSLVRLLRSLEENAPPIDPPSFLAAFTFAARLWSVPADQALSGWTWAWLESQVLAWLKTGCAGQQAGQRLLYRLGPRIPELVREAEALGDDDIHTWAPGLALASCAHETLDGRLFRS